MTGTIKPWSLVGRIREYFVRNPDEEMTYRDIAVKFECSETSARQAVKQLRGLGMLETQHLIRMSPQATAKARASEGSEAVAS